EAVEPPGREGDDQDLVSQVDDALPRDPEAEQPGAARGLGDVDRVEKPIGDQKEAKAARGARAPPAQPHHDGAGHEDRLLTRKPAGMREERRAWGHQARERGKKSGHAEDARLNARSGMPHRGRHSRLSTTSALLRDGADATGAHRENKGRASRDHPIWTTTPS